MTTNTKHQRNTTIHKQGLNSTEITTYYGLLKKANLTQLWALENALKQELQRRNHN